ncbi:hypothetical protein PVAR5_8911 [Paecilomyces variotii No. 5]|uniref:Uncharacterized protein n=1 Tax=Byssochlamys spectabilis (strain No. 5 / NBRC 109023) TaxID=1356009 RepID=V5FQ26_BYSSN|nr:hypothetical protein PVAR5_8911 [Paecilomyces variotii No. 5]
MESGQGQKNKGRQTLRRGGRKLILEGDQLSGAPPGPGDVGASDKMRACVSSLTSTSLYESMIDLYLPGDETSMRGLQSMWAEHPIPIDIHNRGGTLLPPLGPASPTFWLCPRAVSYTGAVIGQSGRPCAVPDFWLQPLTLDRDRHASTANQLPDLPDLQKTAKATGLLDKASAATDLSQQTSRSTAPVDFSRGSEIRSAWRVRSFTAPPPRLSPTLSRLPGLLLPRHLFRLPVHVHVIPALDRTTPSTISRIVEDSLLFWRLFWR